MAPVAQRPSLEALVETGLLRLESLHPGGSALSRELARVCSVGAGDRVLDVASGTGETACLLSREMGAHVTAMDHAEAMIRRAAAKARAEQLRVELVRADAEHLPFAEAAYDVVLCECTLCFLDKAAVLAGAVRALRPGGRLGIHDLCWREGAPESARRALAEIEREWPETLSGWCRSFTDAGLVEVRGIDRSELMASWMRESRAALGLGGQVGLMAAILRRWGVTGAWRILRSMRIFSGRHLGYGIVVGTLA